MATRCFTGKTHLTDFHFADDIDQQQIYMVLLKETKELCAC